MSPSVKLNRKTMDCCFRDVEQVESVERTASFEGLVEKDQELESKSAPRQVHSNEVERVGDDRLSFHFSTCSTYIKKLAVENKEVLKLLNFSLFEESPRTPLLPREKKENSEERAKRMNLIDENVLRWLSICIAEGHMEPAQPSVGRIIGWPTRKFCWKSLYSGFSTWCRGEGLNMWEIPKADVFTLALDRVFLRESEMYSFPSLEVCKVNFLKLTEGDDAT